MFAMSDASDLPPPRVLAVRQPPPPPPRGGGAWRALFVIVLIISLGLNVLMCCGGLGSLVGMGSADVDGAPVREKFHGGTAGADDKIAVVAIEGVIAEGLLTYAHKQIDKSAG